MDTLGNSFHQLHQDGLLILTNVADAVGARIVESLGSKAVATSSAAVAWAHGYQDGDALPLERLISPVESIARVHLKAFTYGDVNALLAPTRKV